MPLYPLVVPFLLVLFRVMGLFVFVPVFSNLAIPGNVKVPLALAISVCIWNVVPKAAPEPGVVTLALAIAGEMSVGLVIGMLVTLVFTGLQLGSHLLSQQMGLSLGAVYDPMFDQQSTVIEQIAFWLGLTVFFAVGGHRQLIAALVQSYQTVPMGHAMDPRVMLELDLGSVRATFHIAVRVGAPGLVAFFVATLATGFIAKSMPQINIMSVGLGMNLLVGMGMILLGLVSWALVAGHAWQGMFAVLGRVFGGGG